jgi:hypothetical protein
MEMNEQQLEEIFRQILEINQTIAKQNALIVQALTLPALMVKADQDD